MKKYWLVLLISLVLLVGCTDNSEKINEEVRNSTYSEIFTKLSTLSNEIQMFPTEANEEDFIYYVKAIKNNCKSYNEDEINSLYNLLNFKYKFSQNDINYTYDDYQKDLEILKKCI